MISALITSVNEPQLQRCIDSVKNQIVPFSQIVHVDCVSPEAKATKIGIDQITQDWYLAVGGDMILYLDTTKKLIFHIERNSPFNIGAFIFSVHDSFLKLIVGTCILWRTKAVRSVEWKDVLRNDRIAVNSIGKYGWGVKKLRGRKMVVVGTHFDNPDKFQIFRRFFISGIKGYNVLPILNNLYNETGDSRYQFALEASKYGIAKKNYDGSHNIEYDRMMYEEFRENIHSDTCTQLS